MKTGVVVGIIIAVLIIGGVTSGILLSSGKSVTKLSNPAASQNASSSVKEFTMTAKQFSFDPNTITVNQGDTVIIRITSLDVLHGFALPEFGISQQLPPGQEETVKFVADKKGTFAFFCNIPCGVGHNEMTGTLIVN